MGLRHVAEGQPEGGRAWRHRSRTRHRRAIPASETKAPSLVHPCIASEAPRRPRPSPTPCEARPRCAHRQSSPMEPPVPNRWPRVRPRRRPAEAPACSAARPRRPSSRRGPATRNRAQTRIRHVHRLRNSTFGHRSGCRICSVEAGNVVDPQVAFHIASSASSRCWMNAHPLPCTATAPSGGDERRHPRRANRHPRPPPTGASDGKRIGALVAKYCALPSIIHQPGHERFVVAARTDGVEQLQPEVLVVERVCQLMRQDEPFGCFIEVGVADVDELPVGRVVVAHDLGQCGTRGARPGCSRRWGFMASGSPMLRTGAPRSRPGRSCRTSS